MKKISPVTFSACYVDEPVTFFQPDYVKYGGTVCLALLLACAAAMADPLDTWSVRDARIQGQFAGATFARGIFVALGYLPVSEQNQALSSPDGINWTPGPMGTRVFTAVIYGNGLFVAVGLGGAVSTSPDGANWTAQDSGTATNLTGVAFGNGKFVAVGAGGTILTSSNGVAWTGRVDQRVTELLGVTYGNGRFIAVGDVNLIDTRNPAVLTSSNALNWSMSSPIGSSTYLYGAAYQNGLYAVVGDSGGIFVSTDGVSWAAQTSRTTNTLASVAGGYNWLVAVGASGTILTSRDGTNWVSRNSGTQANLFGITFGVSTFVAVGDNQTILQSSNLVSIAITQDVQSTTTGQQNLTATIGPVAAIVPGEPQASITFQWQKNGVDIPGATNPSYSTPVLTPGDNGYIYRCRFGGPDLVSVTGAESTLLVVPGSWIARYAAQQEAFNEATAIVADNAGNVYVTGLSYQTNSSACLTVKYDAYGQQQWVARYDGGGFGVANALAVDSSGSVYVTGSSATRGDAPDFATIKYAADGTQLWLAHYNGPGNGYDSAKAIRVDPSGNVYVTGDSKGTTGFDFATVKYDRNGNQLWVARYDGPARADDSPASLGLDGNGSVYVTGWSTVSDGGRDCATVKYSPEGLLEWVALYHGPAVHSDNAAAALALDGAGNVYVTGYSYASETSYDYITLKYSPDGEQRWAKPYDGPGNYDDQAIALVLDTSTNVIVTGTSYGAGSGADYATIKYNSNGDQLWVARYNGPANLYDAASALGIDAAGNVFVTGVSSVSSTDSDYVTIKYSPTGLAVWTNRYNGPGVPPFDCAAALAVDGAGAVCVTGWSDGLTANQDYLTARYVEGGNPPAVLGLAQTLPKLTIERRGRDLILQWPNLGFVLQSASSADGPFTNVAGAASPYTNDLSSASRFFRLRQNF